MIKMLTTLTLIAFVPPWKSERLYDQMDVDDRWIVTQGLIEAADAKCVAGGGYTEQGCLDARPIGEDPHNYARLWMEKFRAQSTVEFYEPLPNQPLKVKVSDVDVTVESAKTVWLAMWEKIVGDPPAE